MRTLPPRIRQALFPTVLAIAALVGGLARLSGSSSSLAGTPGQGVLWGNPRGSRSDEWFFRTPLLVAQSRNGFPAEHASGAGVHDMGVLADLPSNHWSSIFRPHLLPYRVLDIERAFALEWWGTMAIAAAGVYLLALVLSRRPMLSAAAGALFVLQPFYSWWQNSSTGTIAGYGCASAALVIVASRRHGPIAVGLTVASGYLAACAFAALYPPWIIGLFLALAATCLWVIGGRVRSNTSLSWLTMGALWLLPVAVFGLLLILEHRQAVSALANTAYPGPRREDGGDGNLINLFSAPYNFFVTQGSVGRQVNGLSEPAAAGPILLWIAGVVLSRAGQVQSDEIDRSLSRGITVLTWAGAGLLAWFVLPIPWQIGRFVGLDQVQEINVSYALSVVGILLMVCAIAAYADTAPRLVAGLTGLAFAAPTAWSGGQMLLDGTALSSRSVFAVAIVFGVVVGLCATRFAPWALVALVILLGASAVRVHPLQQGLPAFADTTLPDTLEHISATGGDPEARFVYLGGDPGSTAAVTATGLPVMSGASLYPDVATWQLMDPDRQFEEIWNRFAHTYWFLGEPGADVFFRLVQFDVVWVAIEPCSPVWSELRVKYLVTDLPPTDSPCISWVQTLDVNSRSLWIGVLVPGAEG